MKELIYVLQFQGKGAPANAAGTVIKASTSAASCSFTTTVGSKGVSGVLRPAEGANATFESEVMITGETSFQETGTISFGADHRLYFSTVGEGYLGPSPDPRRKHGTVTWKVDRGTGQFAGATGLITSNFLFDDQGDVTDHHFGVLFLT